MFEQPLKANITWLKKTSKTSWDKDDDDRCVVKTNPGQKLL